MIKQLEIINKWLKTNKLTLNLQKTQFRIFGCYKSSIPDNSFQLTIAGKIINRTELCKYLGVYFDLVYIGS